MFFKPDFEFVSGPPGLPASSDRPAPAAARSPAQKFCLFSLAIALVCAGNCLSDPVCADTDITCSPAAALLYRPVCTGEIQAVFRSDRDGDQEIYGGRPGAFARLTDLAGTDSQPEWTAGGSAIVFMSQRDGNQELYSMDADGGGVLRLTSSPGLDITPAPSLLTGRILFTSERDGNREIYVMESDGGNSTRLTNDPGDDNTPVWALNDSLILFSSDRTGNDEIFVMNADGGDLRQLTGDPASDKGAKWSSTRMQILFSSNRSGTDRVYSMDLDGGNQTGLTAFQSSQPDPAPCDRRLLVRSNADIDGLNPDLDDEIFLLDPDAGEARNLSDDPGSDTQPDWFGF